MFFHPKECVFNKVCLYYNSSSYKTTCTCVWYKTDDVSHAVVNQGAAACVFKRDSIIKLQQFIVIPWIQCNMLTYRASQNTLIQSMFIIVSVTMKLIYIKIQFTNVVHISSAFIYHRMQFSNVHAYIVISITFCQFIITCRAQ